MSIRHVEPEALMCASLTWMDVHFADRITPYRNNLEADGDDLEALHARVHVTLGHEIGH